MRYQWFSFQPTSIRRHSQAAHMHRLASHIHLVLWTRVYPSIALPYDLIWLPLWGRTLRSMFSRHAGSQAHINIPEIQIHQKPPYSLTSPTFRTEIRFAQSHHGSLTMGSLKPWEPRSKSGQLGSTTMGCQKRRNISGLLT